MQRVRALSLTVKDVVRWVVARHGTAHKVFSSVESGLLLGVGIHWVMDLGEGERLETLSCGVEAGSGLSE